MAAPGGSKLIQHAAKRRMPPVLDLDPVGAAAGAVAALAVFGNQTLQAEQAGVPEKIRPNLTLLIGRSMDAIGSARE
jgi:hypothetical protein